LPPSWSMIRKRRRRFPALSEQPPLPFWVAPTR
jgi:hypothetical protein